MDQKGQIWITKSLSKLQKACAQNSGLDVKEIALTKIQHLDFPKICKPKPGCATKML